MKTISIFVILIASAGLVWLYINGPTSNVEFSFTESGIGKYKDSLRPVTFALISDVHVRESPREEITDEEGTKTILKEFMKSMNNDIRPDFIVQLGDFNDGCLANCNATASDDLIIDRLQRAENYTESKTDITWFDVIGNHEYLSGYNADLSVIQNKDFRAIYKAINTDWSKLEDTWFYRDIKGYRFIFLNTAFPYEGISHMVPLEEVNWLREVLESSSNPTFVFMHVPISDGSGSDYDLAINREKITQLLANDDSFVVGFFGHSHHSDKWDGLRKQLDEAGNIYFHIPAPHEWMGDSSKHPWVVVTIEPGEDQITVEVGTGVKRSELSEFVHFLKQRLIKIVSRLVA